MTIPSLIAIIFHSLLSNTLPSHQRNIILQETFFESEGGAHRFCNFYSNSLYHNRHMRIKLCLSFSLHSTLNCISVQPQ